MKLLGIGAPNVISPAAPSVSDPALLRLSPCWRAPSSSRLGGGLADWQIQDELYRQAAVAHRAVSERWARAYEADLDKGVMHVRVWTYDVGLRVRRTPQGYAATCDWITLELRDIPLNRIAGKGLAFERKAPQGVFVARFNPATGWRGEWHRWSEVFPVTFARAAQAGGIARLLQRRRRRRKRAGL